MENVEIIKLKPSEWRVYKTIQLEALKQDPQAFAASYNVWVDFSDEKWQERPSNPNSMLFIAHQDNKPVGMVGVYMHADNAENIADFWGMYISPEYRRLGLGEKLMDAALKAVKLKPEIKKVTLMVNAEQLPAVKFYQKLGFHVVGTTDYVLGDGKKHQLYIMDL